MRKTKRINQKKRKTRRNRKRSTRKMKGGTLLPFSDLADAFSSIKYNIGNVVDAGMVNPIDVPPSVKGGDNPLPYKQMGTVVSNYTTTQTSPS